MKSKIIFRWLAVPVFCFLAAVSFGQSNSSHSDYDQNELWTPLFYPQYGTQYRSDMGTPGPAYWQNSVDYKIESTLDTTQKRITASVEIHYKNNSPDDLPYLWLQMDQNIYRQDSRSEATQPVAGGRFANKSFTKGFELKSVKIVKSGKAANADYLVDDTRMQVKLSSPLKASGGDITLQIEYAFDIPQYGTDRMGRLNTEHGWIYEIAQWYPRMAVYDNVEGWNTLPYLGAGEFYLDYGDVDYSVTLPINMVVVGAGSLQNPKEVLTKTEQTRLDQARKSDKTVFIRTEEDVANPNSRPGTGMKTWRFKMKNTRDVAWAASKAFIWDAAKINLPDGKTALAQSVYPVESAGQQAWGRSTEFTKASIERYSEMWYPFPYEVATNVAGIVGGMEYPGFVFCSYRSRGAGLWNVTVHEFGHTWYPMIVGSNERKYPWMDEGFNTFINDEVSEWFNNGEFYRAPNRQSAARSMFSSGDLDPIMTIPDVVQASSLGRTAYSKPAMALEMLREVVVGQERFDYAFRKYTSDWAFKHPTPWDFFHAIENGVGEDLAWFWRAWIFNNWTLDQSVNEVKYVQDDPSKGALITIENRDKMAMPVIISVKESNGKDSLFKLPVEIWQRGGTWTFAYPSTSALKSVIIDPNKVMPDVNPSNNEWVQIVKAPADVTAQSVVNNYINAIGGADKLKNVKDLTTTTVGTFRGGEIHITRWYKAPDKNKSVTTVPSFSPDPISTSIINGDQVRVQSRGREIPVNDEMKVALKEQLNIFPELKFGDPGYSLDLEGIRELGGADVYILKVTTPEGKVMTNYYDVKSGLKVKSEEQTADNGRGGRGNFVGTDSGNVSYSDYKSAGGILFPFSQTVDNSGFEIELIVKDIKVNSGISDSEFK